MSRKVAVLVAFVLCMAMAGIAVAKEARIEGKVMRRNTDKSTLTVHVDKLNVDKTVNYDASTKWNSAYHKDKNPTAIDASQVNDGDYVICLGSNDDKGDFHATMISKRLTHSPK